MLMWGVVVGYRKRGVRQTHYHLFGAGAVIPSWSVLALWGAVFPFPHSVGLTTYPSSARRVCFQSYHRRKHYIRWSPWTRLRCRSFSEESSGMQVFTFLLIPGPNTTFRISLSTPLLSPISSISLPMSAVS